MISVGLFVMTPLFVLFLIACVLFGLGSGLFAPPRVTLLSRIYPERDNTALGITLAAGSVGAAVLPFVAGWLGVRYGWRSGFGILVPLFLAVFVGLWWIIPREGANKSHAIDRSFRHALRRIVSSLRNSSILLTGGAITLIVFTYQGFTSFFPTYLVATKGIQQDTATTIFAIFFATGAIVQPLAGRAADRVGDRPLFLSLSALTTITLGLLPFVDGILTLGTLAVFLGVRAGLGPINNAYLVAILPDDVQGASYGFIRTVYLGIGATGSIVVGLFADADLFDEAFLVLAGLTAVAFVLYLFLPPRSSH